MSTTIQLPLWLALVAFAVSALWLVQNLLMPSARWFVRRRANKLIERLNDRLALRLPGFKLTRRDVLVDRLSFDPRLLELVDRLSAERDCPREQLMGDVRRYAREIVPAFNALVYFSAAYRLARRLVHALYRVRLGYADDAALAELGPESSVVFLMNHRSNMDYILATYLAAERTALSYAVGEWARVWPLQQLIRAMGGYFVRRDSGDPLYRRTLECYVQMAAEGGVPQAIFPEGRLSRDGRLAPARLGLLGYLTRGFDPDGARDIVFIPVGINYDRVFEDRSLLRDADRLPRRGTAFKLRTTLGFVVGATWQALRGQRFRDGYACVNFGEPVSYKGWLAGRGADTAIPQGANELGANEAGANEAGVARGDVADLADDLMRRVGAITPILPVALVARVLLTDAARSRDTSELGLAVRATLDELEAAGHRAYLPRGDVDYAVEVGLRMLVLRGLVRVEDGRVSVVSGEIGLIGYYANSIAHLPQAGEADSRPSPIGTTVDPEVRTA